MRFPHARLRSGPRRLPGPLQNGPKTLPEAVQNPPETLPEALQTPPGTLQKADPKKRHEFSTNFINFDVDLGSILA